MAEKLTYKQQAFVDAYLGESRFNGYRAAKIAGYKGNGRTLRAIASENLTKPNIKAEIAAHFAVNAMTANELTSLLADQARVNLANYYEDDGTFDLAKFKTDGYGHLIKSIKKDKEGELVIEFVDKIKSQEMIGKHLALFVDRQEITGKDGLPLIDLETWNNRRDDRRDEAEEILEQFDETE